jgi:hypothetical protein
VTKLEKTISAARKQLRSGNRIEAIKAVRAAYPDAGLKGAKDFVDWLEMQALSISAAAVSWCIKHWQPFNFDQPEGHYVVAHADALTLDTAPCSGMQPPQLLAALKAAGHFSDGEKSKAPSKPVKCKCGDPVCADLWHRLARWMEEDVPRNWPRVQEWVRALDEDAEAPRTFETAPGLWLVWSGAKIELTEEIAERRGA